MVWPGVLVVVALLCAAPMAVAAAPQTLDEALASLDAVIGFYPPAITSDQQKKEVIALYTATKARLDAAVKRHPDDLDVLHRRAVLESMGHNLDLEGAFKAAEQDFRAVLAKNPTHERAILDLARMWVNASPDYAPRAENLFKAAQCLHKDEPLEEAQRGLFFAYYYQGRLEEAKQQTRILRTYWSDVEVYKMLDEAVESALGDRAKAMGETKISLCK